MAVPAPRLTLAERLYLPEVLRGIGVTTRIVDSSQYVNRVRSRDYDIIVTGWAESLSPGNELRDYFGLTPEDLNLDLGPLGKLL